jgi:ATP-dependent exoDNAse (exonuclease V) alpha subunit
MFFIGDVQHLSRVLAPAVLHLKVGCPIMVLRNLGGNVVNGTTATIHSLEGDKITISLQDGSLHTIERTTFSRYDPGASKDIASRKQFPLKPAFGITYHKSQGLY